MEEKIFTLKKEFLEALLKHVPFKGWSDELLPLIEQEMQLDLGYHQILFPGEIKEIINFYHQQLDQTMLTELSKVEAHKIREKIFHAVCIRLKLMTKPILQQLLCYYKNPLHMGQATAHFWSTVDAIWQYAGDQSTDYNYYTKRGLLFAVYSSGMINYAHSTDENCSWEFVQNRINNVLKIGELKRNLPKSWSELRNKIPFLRLFK